MHDLASFTADSEFKSYEELDARLKQVLGRPAAPRIDQETLEAESDFNAPDITASAPSWTESVDTASTATEEDDTLSYFAKLAEED